MITETLINKVIDQMKIDIANEDWTAIAELLVRVDEQILRGFLSEEKANETTA